MLLKVKVLTVREKPIGSFFKSRGALGFLANVHVSRAAGL
jgi:hypothetical protein